MGLTNYEKQKRWRARHRALYNLQQRNRRAGRTNLGLVEKEPEREAEVSGTEMSLPENPPPFATKKVGEFRMIVIEPEKPPETSEDARPLVFRNDYGSIITERQWNALQEKKEKAKKGGYVLDEWSQ